MQIPQTPAQVRPNIDLSSALDVVCEKCASDKFREVVFIKKVSAIVSPNGKETLVPVSTFCCAACGHVNQEFHPFANRQ